MNSKYGILPTRVKALLWFLVAALGITITRLVLIRLAKKRKQEAKQA